MDLSAAIGIVLLAAVYTLAAWRLERRPTQRQVFFFCLLILAMLAISLAARITLARAQARARGH